MATRVGDGPFGVILRHTTTRPEGDFAIGAEPGALAGRRRRAADHPWVWLRQVHGATVVTVTADNRDEVAGTEADALVTAETGVVLAVQTADCVPVALASPAGVVGVAHAGWRGLEAGVIERTAEAMRALGAESIEAHVGPFIGPECYEFGDSDLDRLSRSFGPEVRSTTHQGTPALDLGQMVSVGLSRAGVAGPPELRRRARRGQACTACQADRWFSYRVRAEAERMATLIWREPSSDAAMSS